MKGSDLVSLLVDELGLKIPPMTKSQWGKRQDISKAVLRNAFKMVERHTAHQSIRPIVEFHQLKFDHGKTSDSFANRVSDAKLVNKLRQDGCVGIYAFFDASGCVIYIGKTEKNTLFNEMSQRYSQKSISGRVIRGGKSKPLNAKIQNIAEYFSAYAVEKHLISNVEALLTRMILNNASNIRVESFTQAD
jgi:hypothetical protein